MYDQIMPASLLNLERSDIDLSNSTAYDVRPCDGDRYTEVDGTHLHRLETSCYCQGRQSGGKYQGIKLGKHHRRRHHWGRDWMAHISKVEACFSYAKEIH